MFHSIGRTYGFGFGQAQFSRKVPGRNGWRGGVLVVASREGVEKVQFKYTGRNVLEKCLEELW